MSRSSMSQARIGPFIESDLPEPYSQKVSGAILMIPPLALVLQLSSPRLLKEMMGKRNSHQPPL